VVGCDDGRDEAGAIDIVFSSRLPNTLTTNAFSSAIAELRAHGVALIDLTATNPTTIGLSYPAQMLASLADVRSLSYTPSAFGLLSARQAVADEMSTTDRGIDPDRVVLTASTSEAYSLLFKLLCDPGDQVLTPEPSYPLFTLLTQLDAVEASPYQLVNHGVWSIDRDSLVRAWTPRTRAILVVSPNNPTGSMLRQSDREWLVSFAQQRRLALVSDEVFAGYPIEPRSDASSLLGEDRVLTFTLGGLSKSVGLPQVKLGWMVVSGPTGDVTDALQRLEIICDTYLSVSTPVQVAAARLLADGALVRERIRERVRGNYQTLLTQCARYPAVRVLAPEGGWCAVIQVPSTIGEEALVMRILQESHVVVHPGYFFDFHSGAHLVVSLLPDPGVFATGLRHVLEIAV
jgi:alanine-synthesizing transaminase